MVIISTLLDILIIMMSFTLLDIVRHSIVRDCSSPGSSHCHREKVLLTNDMMIMMMMIVMIIKDVATFTNDPFTLTYSYFYRL